MRLYNLTEGRPRLYLIDEGVDASDNDVVTMVAGSGVGLTGYSDGTIPGIEQFGNISSQPVVGHLVAFLGTPPLTAYFHGDAVVLLTGATLYIDGIPFVSGTPSLTVLGGQEMTEVSFSGTPGFTFVEGQTYYLEMVIAPMEQRSQVYIDSATLPLGDISTMTADGEWGLSFNNINFTGGLINTMESDGIRMNGNILRADMTQGPFGKITVLIDVTLTDPALATFGDLIAVNPNVATPSRIRLLYGSSFYRGIVPDNVSSDFWISPLNVRTTVGIEVDLVNGVSKLIGGDGEVLEVASLGASPTNITRIELFKACRGKAHSVAIIAEGA